MTWWLLLLIVWFGGWWCAGVMSDAHRGFRSIFFLPLRSILWVPAFLVVLPCVWAMERFTNHGGK
jgi:hypothetical protein